MKKFLLLITWLFTHTGFAQQGKALSDSSKFNTYLARHTSSFTFNGQKPIGPGWDLLEKQFADNQFVAWGEYHNSGVLSQLSCFALEAASRHGFKNWCVEVSPFVASELMRISTSKSPYDSLLAVSKDHPTYGTFPFFKTQDDAQMLNTAANYKYQIWGIDQEFQMAFPYAINRVYNAQSPKVKQAYQAVRDSLLARWWMPKVKLLDSLRNGIPQQQYKQVLDDIKVSRTIYYEDNSLMRATLMKKNFYRYYDQTKAKNEKVFFKLGANHLAKGLNLMTHLYDMGNAVYELAQRNQTRFTNVYFMLRYTTEDGKIIDDYESAENEYPKEFLKLYNKEKWVVVDLRPLRVRYRNDKTLTEDTYQLIDKYDFVVVSPEIKK
ncbi:hypothetical protein BWI96_00170 [Siphonobacter sp. SORGH_AS_0500]|uniref:hypothetical protein n=1 Tax=Siphonobacter sp. SORGH_AS_0500 TaxID=1864824 RepID=UPI000CCAD340|nr:hypothetical protein [Siphonobacter sp. SORGH_AS_0500]PKK38249.1 hypothetical protein BWI96_00170 [Siphonobacter sp. SORGH_AS_0500]